MRIGVPTEIKTLEYRVGLTPGSVREYVAAGHQVLVQAGAGLGISLPDDAYRNAGATIVDTAEEVFASDLVIKVKEPMPSEWVRLRKGQLLFAYLHLAADLDQTEALLASGCSAVAYETITDQYHGLPLLAPMSEIAGQLAVEAAASALRKQAGGLGILLGGVPGVQPARILVIGGGVVGTHAARMAVGLGADVTILDRSLTRLRQLDELFQGRAKTCFSTKDAIEHELCHADAVIGAVLIPGAAAPKLVTRDMLRKMRKGSVVVDVAIDQGGCFESSRPTTYASPTFEVDGVIHYCVANMPGAVPVTSSHALNNATLPFGLALAQDGLSAFKKNPNLMAGLNIHRGIVTNEAVASSLGLPYQAASEVLGM